MFEDRQNKIYDVKEDEMKKVITYGTFDLLHEGHYRLLQRAKAGDKIAQLVILPCVLPPVELVDSLEPTDRGSNGFGSTGR